MALHRLTHIVMGVPNVEATAAYYAEFGLIPGVADQAVPGPGGRRRPRRFSPPMTSAR